MPPLRTWSYGYALENFVARLQQHLDKTVAAEAMANWSARNEAVRQHRDELAAKLRKLYQPFIKQIIPPLLLVCVGPCRLHLGF